MTSLPPDILSAITARIQSDWPSDPAMQQHLIDRQSSAYVQLIRACEAMEKNEYSAQIIEFACTSWPDDYEMALHTLKRQLASSKAFFEYTRPAVPVDVLLQLKEKTFEEWPGDYEMKLHVLETELDAWLKTSRIQLDAR